MIASPDIQLHIGHKTLSENKTGLSVFLFDAPVVCGAYLCGSAPASREFAYLDPIASGPCIHGLMFSGGSAFGLDAAHGVMLWLRDHGRGFYVGTTVVPIVPAACIFDLDHGSPNPPTPQDAMEACEAAIPNNPQSGLIGAGTGARIGKLIPNTSPSPGGFGHAFVSGPDNIYVKAYAVVNAVGDVFDETGQCLAGARDAQGTLINSQAQFRQGNILNIDLKECFLNTTLVALFTNAALSKSSATRLAKTASSGLARAIKPSFTALDGDIIYATSLGQRQCDPCLLGELASQACELAIRHAVT